MLRQRDSRGVTDSMFFRQSIDADLRCGSRVDGAIADLQAALSESPQPSSGPQHGGSGTQGAGLPPSGADLTPVRGMVASLVVVSALITP